MKKTKYLLALFTSVIFLTLSHTVFSLPLDDEIDNSKHLITIRNSSSYPVVVSAYKGEAFAPLGTPKNIEIQAGGNGSIEVASSAAGVMFGLRFEKIGTDSVIDNNRQLYFDTKGNHKNLSFPINNLQSKSNDKVFYDVTTTVNAEFKQTQVGLSKDQRDRAQDFGAFVPKGDKYTKGFTIDINKVTKRSL